MGKVSVSACFVVEHPSQQFSVISEWSQRFFGSNQYYGELCLAQGHQPETSKPLNPENTRPPCSPMVLVDTEIFVFSKAFVSWERSGVVVVVEHRTLHPEVMGSISTCGTMLCP